jgi:hypothetical protein
MRDDRRKEDDEARGTRFGQEILDTDVYEENARTGYLNFLPGTNDDDVCYFFNTSNIFYSFSFSSRMKMKIINHL